MISVTLKSIQLSLNIMGTNVTSYFPTISKNPLHEDDDDDDDFVDEFTVINSHFCFVRNKTFAIKSSSSELERICRSETKNHIEALYLY